MTRSAWITLFHHPGVVRPSPFAVLPSKGPALISPPTGKLILSTDYSRGLTPLFSPPSQPRADAPFEGHTEFDDPPDFVTERIGVLRPDHSEMDEVDAWHSAWEAIDRARELLRKAHASESADRESLWKEAGAFYREVRDLVGPPGGTADTPLARFLSEIKRGDIKLNDLQTESVFEYALFSHPRDLHEVLDDISVLRVRIEERLKAIDSRIREMRRNRMGLGADPAAAASPGFTTTSIERRIGIVRQRLDESAAARAGIAEELRQLRYDYDMLVNARYDLERKRRGIGLQMENHEATIRRVRSASPLYGIRDRTRRKRRVYHEVGSESSQRLHALKHELEEISTACASFDERIELRLAEMRDYRARNEKYFAERLALYAEEDALNAALHGDTSWMDVLHTHRAEQERALYKARIAESSALMRFAGHAERIADEMAAQTDAVGRERRAFLQRAKHYEMVEETASSILNDLYAMSDNRHADIRLLAHMQLVESLACQSEAALRRRDNRDLKKVLLRLDAVVEGLALEVDGGSLREISLAADHIHDVAVLMTRMGMHDRAMKYAHVLAASPVYGGTRAALSVPTLEVARPLMHATGKYVHAVDDAFGTHWIQRGKAAIRFAAYGRRFVEPMLAGCATMCAAFGAQYALTDSISPLVPALAAAGVTSALRAIDGWKSPGAVSAWRTGIYDATARDTAGDVMRFGMRAGLGAMGWFIPSLMLSTVAKPEMQTAFAETLSNIFHVWGERVPSLITGMMAPLGQDAVLSAAGGFDIMRLAGQYNPNSIGDSFSQGYAYWLATLGSNHPWMRRASLALPSLGFAGGLLAAGSDIGDLYRLYMTGAGLLYGAYVLKPSWRGKLRDVARYFIPGAIMLGAHLGLRLRSEEPWSIDHLHRLGLGSAVLLEGVVMLLMTGTIPLPFVGSRQNLDRGNGRTIDSHHRSSLEFFRVLARGLRDDANHMFMVAMAITVGISSALGGLILEDVHGRATTPAMYAMLGAMTGLALLPMPLLVSGVLKQQIPIIPSIEESLEETRGMRRVRRAAEAFASGAYAFTAPYVWNRIWRVPSLDMPAAFARTIVGWDSLAGYLPFMLINAVFANPTASMMRPETAGTPWQHDAMTALLDKDVIDRDKLLNHWRRSAQQLSALHFFLFFGQRRHELKDWSYPLFGIRRIWDPPTFPLKRQVHYLGEFFHYVTGQTSEPHVITPTKLRMLLGELWELTKNPRYHDTVRSIIQVLYMARLPDRRTTSSRAKPSSLTLSPLTTELRTIISAWFSEHPGIVNLMHLNTRELIHVSPGMKRKQRRTVRGALKLSWQNYMQRIDEFHGDVGADPLEGLFR